MASALFLSLCTPARLACWRFCRDDFVVIPVLRLIVAVDPLPVGLSRA
jgi:hypothetical protein